MGSFVGYGVIAASVWLAWETIKVPVSTRAPPAIATRIAPTSPEVLRRAAEAELQANRNDNASALADEALVRGPFNARALRVRGLAAARDNETFAADQMLTLAGNWSLRDDPSHAWLVEHRLRRGDYGSSFAHADTLVRRRTDLHETVFDLFTTASIHDPRALQVLVRRLAAAPPWRESYWDYLHDRDDGAALLLTLAVSLQRTAAPLTGRELSEIYLKWASQRRFEAMRFLRTEVGRPPASTALQNGDFTQPADAGIRPFGWRLGTGPGLAVEISADDVNPDNKALLIHFSGEESRTAAAQYTLLAPGRYILTGRQRVDTSAPGARLAWRVVCATGESQLAQVEAVSAAARSGSWASFTTGFVVPSTGCPAQTVSLVTYPADRYAPLMAWIDDMEIRPDPGATR